MKKKMGTRRKRAEAWFGRCGRRRTARIARRVAMRCQGRIFRWRGIRVSVARLKAIRA
jgi:hypothetical protein